MKQGLATLSKKNHLLGDLIGKSIQATISRILKSAYLLFLTTLLLSACSKNNLQDDEEPEGPEVLLRTSGYLCTGSPTSIYNFWNGTATHLTGYRPDWARPEDKIRFTNNSNGTVSIELMTPKADFRGRIIKYLGLVKVGNPDITDFPNNQYQFLKYIDPAPQTEFFIHRQENDVHQFTIESALYRGQFFNRGKAKSHLGVDNPFIVGGTGKLLWYFK